MSLKRRLKQLEHLEGARTDAAHEEAEEIIFRAVLVRMTDEELEDYEEAVERARESGGVFSEEDEPILRRAEALYREVTGELTA